MTDAPASAIPDNAYDLDDSLNRCYLCGRPDYSLVHRVEHYGFPFEFHRCHCGLEKQAPMPNEHFFEWFFNSDLFFSAKEAKRNEIWGFYDYFKDESSRMATSEARFRKLRPLFREHGVQRLMKIGPSTGTFLDVAQRNGMTVRGCDVSETFVDYASSHYGVTIDHGRFEHMDYAPGSFDAVMLFNVIENVPNQESFLEAIHRSLSDNGLLVLNYVDMHRNLLARLQGARYFLYRPPICYAYSREVMQRVLQKFGFAVIEHRRDIRYMHAEKILSLLGWYRLLKLVRLTRLHQVPFPIYAYPSHIIVARKVSLGG